jgi:hypothetical protein
MHSNRDSSNTGYPPPTASAGTPSGPTWGYPMPTLPPGPSMYPPPYQPQPPGAMPWEIPMMLGRVLQGQEAQAVTMDAMKTELSARLDRIDARLEAGDARMAAQDSRLGSLEAAPPQPPSSASSAAPDTAAMISAAERWGKSGLGLLLALVPAYMSGGLGAVLAKAAELLAR